MKKSIYTAVAIIIVCVVIVVLWLNLKESKVIVFAYHKIVPTEIKEKYFKDDPWIDTVERFEQQMKYLNDLGYKTISMDEYELWYEGKKELPLRTAMITIDDGDLSVYYEILPILKKYNMKATYFMIGEHVSNIKEEYEPNKKQFLDVSLIEKIKKEYPNLEIQSHSYGMHNRNDNKAYVVSMTKEEIEDDFLYMHQFDTDIYCYPYGVHTNEILEVLKEEGYRFAFKLEKSELSTRNDNRYLINRIGINYDTSFSTFKKWVIKSIFM